MQEPEHECTLIHLEPEARNTNHSPTVGKPDNDYKMLNSQFKKLKHKKVVKFQLFPLLGPYFPHPRHPHLLT